MASRSPSDYLALGASETPKIGDTLAFDVYVHLPRAERFIRYVCRGDVWDERKENMIRNHVESTLYRSTGVIPNSPEPMPEQMRQEPSLPKTEAPAEILVFNDKVAEKLDEIFRFVSSPSEGAAPGTIKAMEELSSKIIEVVAPDVENLRENIMQQSKYLMVMTDAAAITSIAVLIAMAHGFNSRKVYRDLSMAILLMDAPLGDLNEEVVLKYYKDRSSLSATEWEELRRHPAKAHEVVSTKLKSVTDGVLNLVLNHHELYNGKGYPRQIRSESLPPIVRSLTLSVDIFEIMKREHLRGEEVDILFALEELREPNTEPHLRRHNQKLVQSALTYIQQQASGTKP
jgi:HD-GYP domain-containing protein (c-di-GMP phosphodiesterase class II)